MVENNKQDIVDLKKMFQKILEKKWKIMIISLVVGVVSGIGIILVPRYYRSEVLLAPEVSGASAGGALSSIASSFGLDLANNMTSDAIYPMLYPNLFESNDFVVDLLSIKVETIDGEVKTDYYDYLLNHQEKAPWEPALRWFRSLFKQKTKTRKVATKGSANEKKGIDPFMLTELQDALVETIKSNVKCDIDKQTEVISITVTDQDPYVCATLVDSVRLRLQHFITQYRTSKSRADMEYYDKLVKDAKIEYDEAVEAYSSFCDTHKDIILQSYISERDELENDMQMKYNTYSAMNTQLQASKAKVQETTPAFTMLQSPSVPIKPAGPKRMLFVLGMMVLAAVGTSFFYVRKMFFYSED